MFSGDNNQSASNPDFVQEHQAMFDSVNSVNTIWQQDVQVMVPVMDIYEQINQFTYWQINTFNEATKNFEYLQAWPRLLPSGEIAWAMQFAVNTILGPAYRFDPPGLPFREPATYGFKFKGPVVIDSSFIVGLNYFQTALSDRTIVSEYTNPQTNDNVYNEVVTIITPKVRRYYSYSINTVIDTNTNDNLIVWGYFNSHAESAPQVIADAFNAYRHGVIPLRADPNAPPGYPNIYLYIPSIDGGSVMNTITSPESSSSKNIGFKGYCLWQNGKIVTQP